MGAWQRPANVVHTKCWSTKKPTVFQLSGDGDGDGDIDCFATDTSGNVLARDTRYYDGCRIAISRGHMAIIRFVFINNGSDASAYTVRIF